ncbi:MAG TPA: histidinol dehydrogenase, partial [Rhodanobacteraceae bacterium]
ADDTANPDLVAADGAAQQEHGADSVVTVLWIGRNVATVEEAIAITNRIAPEHVSVQTRNPRAVAERIENAGAIYCGGSSPVAAGDYIAGSNHVLPTGGSARFFSPLGVYDFVKRTNIVAISDEALQAISEPARRLATFEGLPNHAKSLAVRSLA